MLNIHSRYTFNLLRTWKSTRKKNKLLSINRKECLIKFSYSAKIPLFYIITFHLKMF
ncbi:hypothetical protein HanIR_Chr02g0080341 [Helianthus annuus]|nr:hypothetical protein HanIR_Chr02g0080341 [Helianthus annuus]